MKKYQIFGGNKLYGRITAESAKNSVLALIAGSLLTDEEVVIENCPKINDVLNMVNILSSLGVKAEFVDDCLIINASSRKGFCVDKELSKKLRTSIYFMGALVGKGGVCQLYLPGGCNIGKRPIDIHIESLKKLGVKVTIKDEQILCQRLNKKGGRVIFPFPSVGATVNVMLASVLTNGTSIIYNCAKEPEIKDLANFLNSMGAKISGAGTSRIEIKGVKKLGGTSYKPISDRIEIGTYLLAGAIAGGEIEICNANMQNIELLAHKISNISCKITYISDIINIKYKQRGFAFNLETGPFPKFSTDLQPQTLAYLCICRGQSVVKETMFENRFSQVSDLIRMGANVKVEGSVAYVNGVSKLKGCVVKAKDLRGGASLVLAGLNADGVTTIEDVEHIERGYFNMAQKLTSLGAKIKVIT